MSKEWETDNIKFQFDVKPIETSCLQHHIYTERTADYITMHQKGSKGQNYQACNQIEMSQQTALFSNRMLKIGDYNC
jgi:hypothetical protein